MRSNANSSLRTHNAVIGVIRRLQLRLRLRRRRVHSLLAWLHGRRLHRADAGHCRAAPSVLCRRGRGATAAAAACPAGQLLQRSRGRRPGARRPWRTCVRSQRVICGSVLCSCWCLSISRLDGAAMAICRNLVHPLKIHSLIVHGQPLPQADTSSVGSVAVGGRRAAPGCGRAAEGFALCGPRWRLRRCTRVVGMRAICRVRAIRRVHLTACLGAIGCLLPPGRRAAARHTSGRCGGGPQQAGGLAVSGAAACTC